jgi:hypothetical protein
MTASVSSPVASRLPTSLARPHVIGPIAIAACSLGIAVELFGALIETLAAWPLFFGWPVLFLALSARAFGKRRPVRAIAALGVSILAHAAIGIVASGATRPSYGAVMGAVVALATITAAAPFLGACAVAGHSRSLESGDVLLGVAGAWTLGLGVAIAQLTNTDAPRFLPMLAAGAAAIVFALGRALVRRAWYRRAARNEVSGIRVRCAAPSDELGGLPRLLSAPAPARWWVIETIDVAPSEYRDRLRARPCAIAPAPT